MAKDEAGNLFHLFKDKYKYLKDIDDSPATQAVSEATYMHFLILLISMAFIASIVSLLEIKLIKYNCLRFKANVLHFQQIQQGFQVLGFRSEEIFAVYQLLIAILILGEVDFDFDDEGCSVKNVHELDIGMCNVYLITFSF